MQDPHVYSAFDVSKRPPTPKDWEAIRQGLEALCGAKLESFGGGHRDVIVLSEGATRRWTLETSNEADHTWTLRLDWTPQTETLRPFGAHALLRWRKLRDHFQALLGAGISVAADASAASVSLSVICDPRWVFVALAEVEALTRWLEEVQGVLAASESPDEALDGWLAAIRGERTEEEGGWGLIPTVGEVRWVDDAPGWRAGRLRTGGLLVALAPDRKSQENQENQENQEIQVNKVADAVRRRFGLSPMVLEVPTWAREVAAATGVMEVPFAALVSIRLAAVREDEVLRLLRGLQWGGLMGGVPVVKRAPWRAEGGFCP